MNSELLDKVEVFLDSDAVPMKVVIEYETPLGTFGKDIFVTWFLNEQKLDNSIACGDLGRIKSKSGKHRVKVDYNKLKEDVDSIYFTIEEIYNVKPPIQKTALKTLIAPHWGHKQLEKFGEDEDTEKNLQIDQQQVNETISDIPISEPKQKAKRRWIAPIIGTLLIAAAASELTSRVDYQTSKERFRKGESMEGQRFYIQSNNLRRSAIVLTGTAIVLNIGNALNIIRKGRSKMRDYKMKYPKGRRCLKF